MKKSLIVLGLCATLFTQAVAAACVSTEVFQLTAKGRGVKLGKIEFVDTSKGLLIKPWLYKLKPGSHGFHFHQNPSCANKGDAAGSHLDPQKTQQHLGPFRKGHLGDLPVLMVDSAGKARMPLLAPRLTVAEIKGRAIIIHQGGDNYSDKPEKLGGGGARIACGVIR